MKTITVLLLASFAAVAQQPAPRAQGRQRPGGPQQGSAQQGSAQQTAPPQTKPEDLSTLQGQVVNASSGEPLRKAAVTLRRAEASPDTASPRAYTATTDATGQFTIANVEPGKYRLSARRTGFVDADYGSRDFLRSGTVLTLSARQRLGNLQFSMTPNAVITGHVLDEDREPMASVQVEAMRYRYTQGKKQLASYGSAVTNDIGEYRIAGLPAGRYYISVAARRNFDRGVRAASQQSEEEYVRTFYPGTTDVSAAAPVDVAAGAQLAGADVPLSKRHTVTVKGHVIDASGSDGRRMMVFLSPRDSLSGAGMTRPSSLDANGNFEIRGVTPGSYNLVAAIPQRGSSLSTRLPVEIGNAGADNLKITINPAMSISGRVRVEGQTPAVYSTMQIVLRPREANQQMFGSAPNGKIAEDGSFTIANVNPDRYSLALSGLPDGFYTKAVRVGNREAAISDVDLSQTASTIEIVLSPNAGQVTGTVQNDRQQAAPGVTVVLIPQEPERRDQPQFYKTGNTDDTGHFTLNNLDPGQYKIYAWQDIESGAYMDPDFVKPVEDRGAALAIKESGKETVQLKLIS